MKENWKNYFKESFIFVAVIILIYIVIIAVMIVPYLIVKALTADEMTKRFWLLLIIMITASLFAILGLFTTPFYIMKTTELYYSYKEGVKNSYPRLERKKHPFIITGIIVGLILTSLTALIVNVSANALLFRYFPYTSAAVSALISSLICFILGYVLYYLKEKKSLFSISRATAYFIASLFFGTLLFISRELLVLRIILFLLICVLALPSLNVALSLIKEGDSKGQKGEIRG